MNQGRIWTVVNPSIGLPLLLGSVTLAVLLVHGAVLSNTTWYPAFFSGKIAVSAPAAAPVAAPVKK